MPPFEFFDRDGDVLVTRRNLPHWDQPGAVCFITFRTADSLPTSVFDLWRRQRNDWLRRHDIDPNAADWAVQLSRLEQRFQRQFHETISREFHNHLDNGHGECVLRRPDLAKIVADALHHFDGERYHLGDYVVMPNHVHVLAQFLGTTRMRKQCTSWMKYSAIQINKMLGRKGHFWQTGPFDHLVRNAAQFERIRNYIAANPQKARLGANEYLHYRRPEERTTSR